MQPLDHLLETLPCAQGNEPEPVAAEMQQALDELRKALADADDPILCLNQTIMALDALALGDDHWTTVLPDALRAHGPLAEQHADHWREAARQLAVSQAEEYTELLDLGSQPARYPRQLLDDRQQLHQARLHARFGQAAPDEARLKPWRTLLADRQAAWKRAREIILAEPETWRQAASRLATVTVQAMRAESALQALETDQPASDLFAADGQIQWLAVEAAQQRLPGVWVMTERHAWSTGRRDRPLWIWMQGEGGGLACAGERDEVLDRLAFTLREGALPAAAALPDLEPDQDQALRLVAVEQGLPELLAATLEHWLADLASATPELHEQRLELARAALAVPADTCRQVALSLAERQWQADALIEYLPSWVLSRSDAQRAEYARSLQEYHGAALALEFHLLGEAPAFSTWAGNLLKARIQKDLGIELEIDEILLWRPDPTMDLSLPYLPSTVAEVACESFDPDSDEEYTRLDLARWHIEGIDHDYLARVLPELDPLKQYERKLRALFEPESADDLERLRRPYMLELKLLALSEYWRGNLSERGSRMLAQAAEVTTREALEALGMRLHWLVVHSTQELGDTLEGASALVDAQGHALIYLPDATTHVRLIERDSLEEALAYLASCIASTPQLALYVAQRSGTRPSALLSYLQEAALRGYSGYLRSVPTLEQSLVGVRLAGRCNRLINQAREEGRSQFGIRLDNTHASHLRHVGYVWLALGVVPGLGTWQSVTAIYDGAQEVVESWRSGDSIQMIRGTLSVALGLIDILMTVIPVGSSLSAVRRIVRQAVRQRMLSQPWRGYASGQLLHGAEPLRGIDSGTWRQHGKQYIWQDSRAYEVYRRSGEATLRLRATPGRLYEAPVRREGARWVMHTDVGLRGGGGRLTDAERVFADWGPNSRHRPFQDSSRASALHRGRQALARYDFPDNQRRVEFAYALVQDGVAPDWATQYLRTGAHPVQPVPLDGWEVVRWNLGPGDTVRSGARGRVDITFAGAGQTSVPGVRIAGHYYPILPGVELDNMVHVRPAGTMPTTLAQLDELIARGAGPIRVTLGDSPAGAATVLGGYTETFGQRLATRFPSLSEHSRAALGEHLFRQAEPSTQNLTHTRLVQLQRRLADPHLDPLRELAATPIDRASRQLTLQSHAGAFRQLSWRLQPSENQALREALTGLDSRAFDTVMREVLTARGYQILHSVGPAQNHLTIFRRTGLPQVYLLLQERTMGQLSLQGTNGLVLLSEPWLDMVIANLQDMRLAGLLRLVRRQGTLRPLLGGVHLEGASDSLLVWERTVVILGDQAPLANLRNWRHELRALGPGDRELIPGLGLYGVAGEPSVVGARVNGRYLPVFPVEQQSRVLLTRSSSLHNALTFDDLERCLRERFTEQPWIVVRGNEGWSVRRPMFSAPLDRRVGRARPGLTRQSALNASRHVFERAEGGDHQRLLYLENVTSGWAYGTRPVDALADPLLILREQVPTGLQGGQAWHLALSIDTISATPGQFYLSPTSPHSQRLLAAVSGSRMRRMAPNLIDDMLVEYGLTRQHRAGTVALYHQPGTGRSYLVALATTERAGVDFAFHDGRALLSEDWLGHWRQQLPAEAERLLQQAQARGRLERLVAVLCLQPGPHAGQVAVIRLAPF